MKESLKYQKPKYFVLEILMTSIDYYYMSEGVNQDALDKMRFSLNKLGAINSSIENPSERISYYFNIIKYHSRWNELNSKDFKALLKSNIDENKGFTYLSGSNGFAYENDITNITEIKNISEKNEKYLIKIIQLAKEHNIELILVKTPYTIKDSDQMYYNYVEQLAKENNIRYINYNLMYNELNLNFEKDFYDAGHLNGEAAKKITVHFSNHLKKEFNIGDKKND